MPGDAGTTETVAARLDRPFAVTITGTLSPSVTSYGTCALTCPPLTNTSGAGLPPTVTDVPLSDVASGSDFALSVAVARSVPKMLNSEPGATFAVKLAAFTAPPGAIAGGAFTSSVNWPT